MQNIANELLLLTIKLSQLKNRERIVNLFLEGISVIFNHAQVQWHDENQKDKSGLIPVNTRMKTYGYIETDNHLLSNPELFPYLQNAIQLLAVILEKNEQDKKLSEQQRKLKDIIYQQTQHLIEKHDELAETNEEFATANEELIESNRSLIDINNQLYEEIEKREEAEKKLLDSDKFFNHSTDMFCIAGFDGYFKVLNPAWQQILGWGTEEMLAKPWVEFVHPDDVETTKNIKSTIVEGKEVYHFENRYLCKDGSFKWLSWNSYPYPEEQIMFGVARDVTLVKQAEKKLKESEERFKSIVQSSPNGLYFYQLNSDNQLIFKGANPAADRIIGFKHEGFIGKTIQEAFPNLANTFVPGLYEKVARGEEASTTFEIEYEDANAKGYFDVTVYQTEKNAIAVEFIDISNRHKTEEQLRTLTLAIDQSPNSVVITNTDGEIEYINPVIEKLSGYKKEELIGQNPRIFASGKTSKEEYKVLWDTITAGNVWNGEFQNKKKNGELLWESAIISPVFDNKGKITHYLAIREDISEQKMMTQELIAAKERAEESDHLKTAFLANMSHEIRTPMNSIMGFASLLPDEESKELMCNYAKIIIQNSEQLVHIIDDIVVYSQLQTKLFTYRPTTFNINDLLLGLKQTFNLPDFQKGVELLVEPTVDNQLMITTDFEKLRQVFTNLISNAFKYTQKGSITIGLNNDNGTLTFFVKDTGIGILPNEKEKVFERFFRGNNVNMVSVSGTGLGLSIVKELVDLLGGRIWVESELDKGSIFYFTIASAK